MSSELPFSKLFLQLPHVICLTFESSAMHLTIWINVFAWNLRTCSKTSPFSALLPLLCALLNTHFFLNFIVFHWEYACVWEWNVKALIYKRFKKSFLTNNWWVPHSWRTSITLNGQKRQRKKLRPTHSFLLRKFDHLSWPFREGNKRNRLMRRWIRRLARQTYKE